MWKKLAVRMAWWLPLGGVVTLIAVNRQDLVKVLSIWFNGDQTSGTTLWGLKMVWWGRMGKGLQFIAACAIVLDLIGPDRLRKIGQNAREQLGNLPAFAARINETEKLMELYGQIESQIIHVIGAASEMGPFWFLVGTTSPLPDQPWFTTGMVDQLRRNIKHGMTQVCTHRTHDSLCSRQVKYIYGRVREFFRDHLPPHERDLFDRRKDFNRIENAMIAVFASFFVSSAFTGFMAIEGVLSWWWAILNLVVVGVMGAIFEHMSTAIGIWFRATIIGGMARAVAALLDRSQPGHPLRWAGFFIFIVGFSLDLLAS